MIIIETDYDVPVLPWPISKWNADRDRKFCESSWKIAASAKNFRWLQEVVCFAEVTVNLREGSNHGLVHVHAVCRGDRTVKAYPLRPPQPFPYPLLICHLCSSSYFSLFLGFTQSIFLQQYRALYQVPYCKSPASFFHVFARKLGHLDVHVHRHVCCFLHFDFPDVLYCLCGCTSIRSPLHEGGGGTEMIRTKMESLTKNAHCFLLEPIE